MASVQVPGGQSSHLGRCPGRRVGAWGTQAFPAPGGLPLTSFDGALGCRDLLRAGDHLSFLARGSWGSSPGLSGCSQTAWAERPSPGMEGPPRRVSRLPWFQPVLGRAGGRGNGSCSPCPAPQEVGPGETPRPWGSQAPAPGQGLSLALRAVPAVLRLPSVSAASSAAGEAPEPHRSPSHTASSHQPRASHGG